MAHPRGAALPGMMGMFSRRASADTYCRSTTPSLPRHSWRGAWHSDYQRRMERAKVAQWSFLSFQNTAGLHAASEDQEMRRPVTNTPPEFHRPEMNARYLDCQCLVLINEVAQVQAGLAQDCHRTMP
ncbi:hypothetical protein DV515_00000307 [Chloebia gouldiae]|uniref:Uncharacterized protein n=1 Tax=Chloebia gouldiae TaxID=44316 RepID=A0A3L8T0S2_CHLGU|nr:hypothetical protein DV515_00000307 [Chloebia gouldiae]